MFSSGVAQSVNDWNHDEDPSRKRPVEQDPSFEESREDIESDREKDLNDSPPQQPPDRPGQDSIADTSTSSNEQNNTLSDGSITSLNHDSDLSASNISNHPIKPRTRRLTPAAEKFTATSELYHAAFGNSLDWEKAVDTVSRDNTANPRKIRRLKILKRWRNMHRNTSKRSRVGIPSVRDLATALWQEEKSNQYIFRLYRDIPSPGVSYFSKRTRGELLRRFSRPPERRWVDARRYLALVEDMISSGLPMSRSLWTSAIHLAGRAAGKVKKHDLIRAIGVWQQMEHVAGIKSDHIVFNTLFDVSIKAGQFTVADRLVAEMKKRGLGFDRCGKVTMIYYHGLRQDFEGIRRTYNEFVDSGEFVDTMVLNCLLASFIRAGQVKTAELLYLRMMQAQATTQKHLNDGKSHHSPTLSPEFNIYRRRAQKLTRLLKFSMLLKIKLPEHYDALQDALPMTPDTRTFHIFLKFHAHESGDLPGFMSVLADMENTFAVPPRGMIYLLLFEGFAQHGRRRKAWSAERLQEAWRAFLRALHESKHRMEERFLPQTRKIVWENPLASTAASTALKPKRPTDNGSGGLYTALPSAIPSTTVECEKGQTQNSEPQLEEKPDEEEEDEFDTTSDSLEDIEVDVDELFGSPARVEHEPQQDELEELERRIENGVFLGRRMNIAILRAFGACCGPDEVMDVWMKLERIWQPEKRKMQDVIVVREELERQLNRIRGVR